MSRQNGSMTKSTITKEYFNAKKEVNLSEYSKAKQSRVLEQVPLALWGTSK
jgi:hypothetical protein